MNKGWKASGVWALICLVSPTGCAGGEAHSPADQPSPALRSCRADFVGPLAGNWDLHCNGFDVYIRKKSEKEVIQLLAAKLPAGSGVPDFVKGPDGRETTRPMPGLAYVVRDDVHRLFLCAPGTPDAKLADCDRVVGELARQPLGDGPPLGVASSVVPPRNKSVTLHGRTIEIPEACAQRHGLEQGMVCGEADLMWFRVGRETFEQLENQKRKARTQSQSLDCLVLGERARCTLRASPDKAVYEANVDEGATVLFVRCTVPSVTEQLPPVCRPVIALEGRRDQGDTVR